MLYGEARRRKVEGKMAEWYHRGLRQRTEGDISPGRLKQMHDRACRFFDRQEETLAEPIPLRPIIQKEASQVKYHVYFINSADPPADYIALVQALPTYDEMRILEIDLIFPKKDEKTEETLVEKVREAMNTCLTELA